MLLHVPEGDRTRALLADFGLTKQTDADEVRSTRLMAGTLTYMPPEAFENDATLIHPGVDLYAVGVMVYQLLAGHSPWVETDFAMISAKLAGRHRPLEPSIDVPSHVADIVNQLLHPDPATRPVLAAVVRSAMLGEAPRSVDAGTGDPDDSTLRPPTGHREPWPPAPDAAAPGTYPPPPTLALVREPRLVDRKEQRGALWRAAARATKHPEGLVVSGSPGHGKSRLCRWLGSELEQLGRARTLHVRLAQGVSPNEALARALRRFLVLGNATDDDLRRRVQAWFRSRSQIDRDDAEPLMDWLEPADAAAPSMLDARAAAAARVALVERILRLEAANHLVICWWEHPADAPPPRAMLDMLQSAQANPFPLLVLYEPFGGRSEPAVPGWTGVPVGPLASGDLADLLGDLALPSAESAALAVGAGGSPSQAVESARLLCAKRAQLVKAGDTRPSLPRAPAPELSQTAQVSPAELALIRLDAFCNEQPAGQSSRGVRRELVQLLALLPAPCPQARLERIVGAHREALIESIDDACVQGILERREHGELAFAGTPLLDAAARMLQGADANDRRRRCADDLLTGPSVSPAERRAGARLLADVGDLRGAVDQLVLAAEALDAHDGEAALTVWDNAWEVCEQAGWGNEDTLRVRVGLGGAHAARDQGDVDRAAQRLAAVADGAEDSLVWLELQASVLALRAELTGATEVAVRALAVSLAAKDATGTARARLLLGDLQARGGKREDALRTFERALIDAAAAGAERIELWARWLRARCLRGLRRNDEARDELHRALALGERLGVPVVVGGAERELGNLALQGGQPLEARVLLARSADRLEDAGLKAEAAVTRISLGELARAQGELSLARAEYSAAFTVAQAYGITSEVLVALINLGIVELEMGRARRVSRRLEQIDELLPPRQAHGLRLYIEALRVAEQTGRADWDAAEETMDALSEPPRLPPDPDLLALIERAGRDAQAAGESPLAADAWVLALAVAADLADTAADARIRAAMREA